MSLKPGDILFIDTGTRLGKCIQKLTRFEFSHVAIYMGDGMVLDTDFRLKSSIRSIAKLKIKRVVVKRHEKNSAFLDISSVFTGLKYDYIGALKVVLKANGANVKRDRHPNRFWCSELVDDYFKWIGLDLTPGSEEIATIEDLYNSSKLKTVAAW